MSIIMGALGGAGDAGQSYFAQQQRAADDLRMAQMRSDLDFNKSKLLMQTGEDIKNAPLNRFADFASSQPTTEAAPPPDAQAYQNMQLDGTGGVPGGTGGFQGDITTALTQAQAIKDPDDRDAAIAQIQNQINSQSDAIRANAPQTQPLSRTSIINGAMNDALASGDGPAYAAGAGLYNADARIQYLQDQIAVKQQLIESREATFRDRTDARREQTDMMRTVAEIRAESAAAKVQANTGDPMAADKMAITQAREKRLDLQNQINTTMKKVDSGIMKKEDAAVVINNLEAQQIKYNNIINPAAPASAPNPANNPRLTFDPKTGAFN